MEEIASTFDPFADIRVPEQVVGHWWHIRRVRVGGMPAQLERIVATRILQYLQLVE
jgi:hypothetical protein